MEELLGAEAYRRLIAPATKLMGRPPGDATAFVRKYSPSTRPRLAFHVDGCDASISVNLAVDDYVGADLLLLADRSVLAAPRAVGDAATHDADVAHAVSDITSGVRWSLVVFCHKSKSWRNSARRWCRVVTPRTRSAPRIPATTTVNVLTSRARAERGRNARKYVEISLEHP